MTHLILYDGVCGLCNRLNRFVLRRDRPGVFAFAPLQGATGQRMLARFGAESGTLNTVYIVKDYGSSSADLLSKSTAVLFLLRSIGRPWRWIARLLGMLPTRLLDVGYDVIARHRYRFFGRYDTCPVPTAEHRRRFIDV